MNTERSALGNVLPTAVMPVETAVFAGICDRALIWDGVDILLTEITCPCSRHLVEVIHRAMRWPISPE